LGVSAATGAVRHRHPTAFPAIHRGTSAALRLLVLALEVHPEALGELACYGNLSEHLSDVIEDIKAYEED